MSVYFPLFWVCEVFFHFQLFSLSRRAGEHKETENYKGSCVILHFGNFVIPGFSGCLDQTYRFREFLVKWRGRSYWKCSWVSEIRVSCLHNNKQTYTHFLITYSFTRFMTLKLRTFVNKFVVFLHTFPSANNINLSSLLKILFICLTLIHVFCLR